MLQKIKLLNKKILDNQIEVFLNNLQQIYHRERKNLKDCQKKQIFKINLIFKLLMKISKVKK